MRRNWKESLTFLEGKSRPLIVVLGPTASGKTDFSLELAEYIQNTMSRRQALPAWSDTSKGKDGSWKENRRFSFHAAEIINADSRQLYKFLNIGTAKIRLMEMRGIPHHLLDILDPKEEVTASWYQKEAERVIGEIHTRGAIPILVGGSMLYVSAVIDGLQFAGKSDPDVRVRLEKEYDRDEGKSLYERLEEIDPETAAVFHHRNKPYVVRALEIWELHGRKPSDVKKSGVSPYDLLILGLQWDTQKLSQRITARTHTLFERGWINEVQSLLARGYCAEDPAMKSHGYREIVARLQKGKPSLEELPELIAAKTRHYAKRQMTWWKHDDRIQWIRT